MPTGPRGSRTPGGASGNLRVFVDVSVSLAVVAAITLIVVLALAGSNGSLWAVGLLSPFVLTVAMVGLQRVRSIGGVPDSSERAELVDMVDLSGTDPKSAGKRDEDLFVEHISEYLTGKNVLVTGAGGSVGAALCCKIASYMPKDLVMIDCDEKRLYEASRAVEHAATNVSPKVVVSDIRDKARVDEVFKDAQPQVVFHAAGLSRSSQVLNSPTDQWKTNVLGSNNVLRAAAINGVTEFVNLSSCTAAEPTTALGYTESVVERLTTWYANRSRGAWVSARFGNILDSSDEMRSTLREQLRLGGPLEISHPDKTLHTVTAEEASSLIVHAGAIGARGEVLVLDLGERVRAVDIAEQLMEAAGKSAEITFTGLREGEDLHEALVARSEIEIRRAHPQISHVLVPALSPTKLGLFNPSTARSGIESLRSLCES